jgi:hypothetical protein
VLRCECQVDQLECLFVGESDLVGVKSAHLHNNDTKNNTKTHIHPSAAIVIVFEMYLETFTMHVFCTTENKVVRVRVYNRFRETRGPGLSEGQYYLKMSKEILPKRWSNLWPSCLMTSPKCVKFVI